MNDDSHDAQARDERYQNRFRKVLDYIDEHLDGDLSVARLSAVAAFSKYHFHRQFSGLFGVGVSRYVQLRRMRRASYQLAFRGDQVIDIALANGYETPESFARAFRKEVGQSPSGFREQPQWDPWHDIYQPLRELRIRTMKNTFRIEDVKRVDFKETRVAALEHRGDPHRIGDSVRRFIDWRKQHRLSPSVSATFNVLYDNPAEVAPQDFRLDLCAATTQAIDANAAGIVEKHIPGGRCAVLRVTGPEEMLEQAARFLYLEWLPHSGEELRDFPLFVQRVSFFPDVPEGEAVLDVYLPLRDVV